MTEQYQRIGIIPEDGIPMITKVAVPSNDDGNLLWPEKVTFKGLSFELLDVRNDTAIYTQAVYEIEAVSKSEDLMVVVQDQGRIIKELERLVSDQTKQLHTLLSALSKYETI